MRLGQIFKGEEHAREFALDINYDLAVFQEYPLWCKVPLPEGSGVLELSFRYEDDHKDLRIYLSRIVHRPKKDACESRFSNVRKNLFTCVARGSSCSF